MLAAVQDREQRLQLLRERMRAIFSFNAAATGAPQQAVANELNSPPAAAAGMMRTRSYSGGAEAAADSSNAEVSIASFVLREFAGIYE